MNRNLEAELLIAASASSRPATFDTLRAAVKARRGDVRAALKALSRDGSLDVTKGRRGVNVYALPGSCAEPATSEADTHGGAFVRGELPAEHIPTEELVEIRKRMYAAKAAAIAARQLVTVDVNEGLPFGIVHFGDPHVDDDGTDIGALERHTKIVRETPGLYAGNVGDTTNNWVGRLARLYGEQGTSAAQAWQLCEWFVRSCEWLYMVAGNHACHDEQTEALTNRGWLKIDQIEPDDLVLGLNTETGRAEWQAIERVIRKKSDHINYLENQVISMAVTDDHRLLCHKAGADWGFITFDRLTDSSTAFPASGMSRNSDAEISDDDISLAAWIASDAHVSKNKSGTRTITFYQRASKAHVVRNMLVRSGVQFTESVRHRKIESICGKTLKSSEPEHSFRVPTADSSALLDRLDMYDSLYPQWLWDLSDRQFDIYMSAKVCADGSPWGESGGAVIYDDRASLDLLQALCATHGRRCTFYNDTRAKNEGWRISVCPKRETWVASPKSKARRVTGDFNVWCLTVRLSNFMVRRNDKAHFSGNCWSGAGDPIRWISTQSASIPYATDVRMALRARNTDREIRVNVRHDFAGSSQWNPAHGVMKAAQMGSKDHVLVCGHKHVSGYGVIKDGHSGIVSHALQVASYKVHDRYAIERGFRDQHISPCAVTIMDPWAEREADVVQVFWSPEVAAPFLRWLRREREAGRSPNVETKERKS